jgi:hypothetical protein
MLRQKRIVEQPGAPRYLLILDESVIKRKVGGAAVMAEQLEALRIAAERPNVQVRIVPIDTGGFVGGVGPFTILNLDDNDDDDAVLYRESDLSDALIHDVDQVKRYRGVFEKVWLEALDEAASLRSIVAEAAALRSSLDRR